MKKTPLTLLLILFVSGLFISSIAYFSVVKAEGTPYLYLNLTTNVNSTIDKHNPTATYNNEVTFYEYSGGGDYYRRAFINFTSNALRDDPAHNLINATLYIYYYSSQYGGYPSGSLYAYRPTISYTITSVNWNNQPNAVLLSSVAWGSYGYKALDVTEYVRGIMNGTYQNYGIELRAEESNTNAFVTMDTNGKYSYLEIYATDNPLGSCEFCIFSGFTGTVVSQIWTTFESVALYISNVVITISSGLYAVVSQVTTYFQIWIDVISRVVINAVVDMANRISTFITKIMVGYRTGIDYVIIKIFQPLAQGIDTTIVKIYTDTKVFISKVVATLLLIPQQEVEENPLLIGIGYLIFLLVVLIPTYAFYVYIGTIAVIPSVMLMTIICYISGLCNFGVMLIVLLVGGAIMFRNRLRGA